ncbi:MAG: hypothetical protein HY735_14400 [Verrucomicrobia bacterium]|nr:hypothetical protein [Verrucomicrobiota bacterium]
MFDTIDTDRVDDESRQHCAGMSTQTELFASPQATPELQKALGDFIRELLTSNPTQPAAGEVLALVEQQFGWHARHELLAVVCELREDRKLTGYQRDYLRTTLSDAEINAALRGEARWTHEDHATLDELFRRSVKYRGSEAFREMIEFTAKFRDYAPFNNLLVRLQNPSCGFYAAERDWRRRFGRSIKEDARPMLILAPMHPVMCVYDLDSTEGPPLPEHLQNFTSTSGDWDSGALEQLIGNANRDRIKVDFSKLSSSRAGFVTSNVRGNEWKMRVVIHEPLDGASRFATLCHELAHIYLGHLGGDKDGWWPSRINLTHGTVEIEAEATAYIASIRTGLKLSSDQYLSSHLKSGGTPSSVSLEMIGKVAGKLEKMSLAVLPPRKASESKPR